MSRDVIVKEGFFEVGIGSVVADARWESDPTAEGAIVRLDKTLDGRWFFTFTDAEEFSAAYLSVEVSLHDLATLQSVLLGLPAAVLARNLP